jgi:hypothetical protein
LPDSSGKDLRGGVKFPTGGIARDPVVVRGMCSTRRYELGPTHTTTQVDPVQLRGRQSQSGWKKGRYIRTSPFDPKAYAFGFFCAREAYS